MCVRMAPYSPQKQNYTRDQDGDTVMMIASWLDTPVEEAPLINPPDDEDDYWSDEDEDDEEVYEDSEDLWDDPPVRETPAWQAIHAI